MINNLDSVIKKLLYLIMIVVNIASLMYYYDLVISVLFSSRFASLSNEIINNTLLKMVFGVIPIILGIYILIEIFNYVAILFWRKNTKGSIKILQRNCVALVIILVILSVWNTVSIGGNRKKEDPVVLIRSAFIDRFTKVMEISFQYQDEHGVFPCDYSFITEQMPFEWNDEMPDYSIPRAENCTTKGVLWIITPVVKEEPADSSNIDCKLGLGDQAEFSNLEGVMSCFNYVAERFSDGSIND